LNQVMESGLLIYLMILLKLLMVGYQGRVNEYTSSVGVLPSEPRPPMI
jgi:hypothetical protein